MKTIDYYFIKEFQWKSNWFSDKGLLKAKVYPTNEFIQQFKYVDFNIVGQIFTSKKEFYKTDFVDSIITEIKKVISFESTNYVISSEILLLEIQGINTKPIDLLGDSYGIECPISWNISTPQELQYIPTVEILQLFQDWKSFIIKQNDVILR